MNRLLVVEDENVILKALKRLLERNHFNVQTATSVDEAITHKLHSFDLILADLRLPGEMGTTLIAKADPVPVVIMTSHASVRSAVDAMRHGAIDYIAKPFDHDELLMVIQRSLHQKLIHSQNRALKLDLDRHHPLAQHINSTDLLCILESIMRDSQKQAFVHLHGESGTDRETLAKAVHAQGSGNDGPVLVLDVSTKNDETPKLLFGSNMPTPQTPDVDKPTTITASELPNGGYLQAAQNGTLIIRHPELLTADIQLALFKAVSAGIPETSDSVLYKANNVRIISISDHNLPTLVQTKQLLPELANLFEGSEYEIPALRKRPQDIVKLANRQLARLGKRYGKKGFKISDEAMAALQASEWPGNVADLESVLSHAVFACRTNTIKLADLGLNSRSSEELSDGRDLSLDEYFRYFVIRNQRQLSETELASRLGISRKALWERRQKMQLLRERSDDLPN